MAKLDLHTKGKSWSDSSHCYIKKQKNTEGIFAVFVTLGLAYLVRRNMHPPGHIVLVPLHGKLRLSLDHFGFLMPLNHQAEKEATILTRITNPNYQTKNRFCNTVRTTILSAVQEDSWNASYGSPGQQSSSTEKCNNSIKTGQARLQILQE